MTTRSIARNPTSNMGVKNSNPTRVLGHHICEFL